MSTTSSTRAPKVQWRKVSELKPGAVIAVPSDAALARHDEGRERDHDREGDSADIAWDEIVSVRRVGREAVYDLEVEGTHTFVGNRVIAHNTTTGPLGVTIENNGASTSDLNMFRVISEVGGADNVKFRVDSDGDVFADGTITATSSGTGNITAGSADLAEWYEVADTSLSPGDIVAIGPDGRLVKAAPGVLPIGVVSTSPGLALAYPEAAEKDPALRARLRPIALVGRVKVKVAGSTFATGDPLTLSAEVAGAAVKAEDAGDLLLGVALEPHGGGDGSVMVVLAAGPTRRLSPRTVALFDPATNDYGGISVPWSFYSKNGAKGQEINVDMLGAIQAVEALAGKRFVYARDLKTGADIVAKPAEASAPLSTPSPSPTPSGSVAASPTPARGAPSLDLDVLGALNATGALRVGGPAEFQGPAVFKALVEFIDRVILKNDVEFAGRAVFNKDAAGLAVIRAGHTSVEVEFAKEYAETPIVVATLVTTSDPHSSSASLMEEEQALFSVDVRYLVTNRTPQGFTVKVRDAAPADLTFSWVALAVKDGRTTVSAGETPRGERQDEAAAPDSVSPSPTPTPAPASPAGAAASEPPAALTVPAVTPEASPSPIPASEPSASPATPTPTPAPAT